MSNQQGDLHRRLRFAALAAGLFKDGIFYGAANWNPLNSTAETAELNARLGHDTVWREDAVNVNGHWVRHDGSLSGRLRAWREASMTAAERKGQLMAEETRA